MKNTDLSIPESDRQILRRLAERKAEMANDPVNLERKQAWYALDAGTAYSRPMVLVDIGEVLREVFPGLALQCTHPWACGLEFQFRWEQYQFEVLQDDRVVEASAFTDWKVTKSDYGVQSTLHHADNKDKSGAWKSEPPIQDLDRDFNKLKMRTFSVDRKATWAEREQLEDVFNGILKVGIRGVRRLLGILGMTYTAGELIGIEPLMMNLYDNPDGVHRLMKFLRDDHCALIDWCEREGLLTLNNRNDGAGSGSLGYTLDLPQPDWQPGDPVRAKDLWVWLESQETVGVGPDLFEEFIFPYQRDIAMKFGKCFYGCCEPLHSRIEVIKRLPNLSRVSVSPWADQEIMAQALGARYVFTRKPHPALVSTAVFNEDEVRADLRRTLEIGRAHHGRVELVLKDVCTVNHEPARLARWVQMAREEIDKMYR